MIDLDFMLENSFKDYHVRGFDYVCLSRVRGHTRKVYFFDEIKEPLPEVVSPHDHRYDFWSRALAGKVCNVLYSQHPQRAAELFQRFEYRTPLNGGNGFTWAGEEFLCETGNKLTEPGHGYGMRAEQIHTIRVTGDAVLMLDQFESKPVDFTRTWTKAREPVNLSGLYRKFKPDEMIARLKQINRLIGE